MKNRVELAKYFANKKFNKGAEIGVLRGSYSILLCQENPELLLYCIDSWGIGEVRKKDYHLRKYEEAKERLIAYNTKIIRSLSMDAVKQFDMNSLDFVYIDASHKFDFVMQDIIEWSKRVKQGGIVSGDDYNLYVKDAVDVYVKSHNIELNLTNEDSNWYFIKK